MTSKEKAENLISQYLPICQYKMGMDREYVLGKAKECALVTINEVIENLGYDPSTGGKENQFYWKEVKQEIEKL